MSQKIFNKLLDVACGFFVAETFLNKFQNYFDSTRSNILNSNGLLVKVFSITTSKFMTHSHIHDGIDAVMTQTSREAKRAALLALGKPNKVSTALSLCTQRHPLASKVNKQCNR